MTREERMRFIDKELRGLWPQWDPTEAEIEVWMNCLAPFACDAAHAALHAYYCSENGNYRRPKPAGFLAQVRARPDSGDGAGRAPLPAWVTNTYVECLHAPEYAPHRAGWRRPVFVKPLSRQSDPEHVRACAESLRTKQQETYGGQWIVVRTQPVANDRLVGAAAQEKAHRAVLNGPDTPHKRWLQYYLSRGRPTPSAGGEEPAVSLGEALKTTALLPTTTAA
jgi:hypothetical protein